MDVSTIKQLQKITHFKQLRFECYKPSVGRRINIATKENAEGLAVLHFFCFEIYQNHKLINHIGDCQMTITC